MNTRSRNTIIYTILKVAETESSKTKIMHISYISYAQLKEYISLLVRNKLLYLNPNGKYITTKKGMCFIKMNHEINKLINK